MNVSAMLLLFTASALAQTPQSAPAAGLQVHRNLPYAQPANERQMLDVHTGRGQEPAGRLLDSRRRLAARRQGRNARQAPGIRRQGIRLRHDELPLHSAREDAGHRGRRGDVDPLGARSRRGIRRRSGDDVRHGLVGGWSARGAGLHDENT